MRLTFSGWSRDHGEINVLDRTVGPECVQDESHPLQKDELRAVPFDHIGYVGGQRVVHNLELWDGQTVTAGVRIFTSTDGPVSLSGNYQMEMEFSAEELLLLASQAIRGWPVEALLSSLQSARFKVKDAANDQEWE